MKHLFFIFLTVINLYAAAGVLEKDSGDEEEGGIGQTFSDDSGAGAGAGALHEEKMDRDAKGAKKARFLELTSPKKANHESAKDKDHDSLPTVVEEQVREIEMAALIRNAEALTQNRNIPYIISSRDFWYRTSTVCEGLGEVFLSIAPIITFSSSVFRQEDQIYISFAGGAAGVIGLGLKKFSSISKEMGVDRAQDLIEAIKQQSSDLKSLTDASKE
jgi:hypothetical protein